ncbi:MAG: hypothetical protein JKY99_12300 [Rhizobiales bacterium]|nr:hypothetical protein [Hyphomicrobiales bacterium]
MDNETFNMSLRKFLKKVGVTSQQEIEEAVRSARDAGTLGDGPLQAKVVLTLSGVDLEHVIEADIQLSGDQ